MLIIPFWGEKSTYIHNGEKLVHEQNLNDLFAQLREMPDISYAQSAEQRLYAEIVKSGSSAIDALMVEANNQSDNGNIGLALETYKTITEIKPDYAEGFNQLANMEFRLDLKDEALKDLKTTVRLEPRHFAAWAGIGSIYEEREDYKNALSAYKNAAYYNPNFDEANRGIFRIESKINGLVM